MCRRWRSSEAREGQSLSMSSRVVYSFSLLSVRSRGWSKNWLKHGWVGRPRKDPASTRVIVWGRSRVIIFISFQYVVHDLWSLGHIHSFVWRCQDSPWEYMCL